MGWDGMGWDQVNLGWITLEEVRLGWYRLEKVLEFSMSDEFEVRLG